MNERVPEGWKKRYLSEFSTARRGTSYVSSELSEDKERFPLYINMKSFKVGGGYSKNGDKYFTSPYTPNQLVQDNDLLIANTDVTDSCDILGAPVYLPREKIKNDVLFSHHVSALKISDDVSLNFLSFLLCYGHTRLKMKRCGRGTTVKMLDMRDVGKISFSLPPLPEQKKIASILTSVDEVIEKTQLQIDKLQDLKKGTMNELLTKGIGHTEFKDSALGRIPKSWEVSNLSTLISIKHGYAFEGQYFSNKPNGIILLTPGNFHRDGELYFGEKTKYFTGEIPKEYILENGDLLVVMTDLSSEMPILGNTIILSSSDTVLHNQRIGKIGFSEQIFDLNFLNLLLNSIYVKKNVKLTAIGTTVRHTSPSRIMEQNVPIPSLSEQKNIARVILTIQKNINENQQKLSQIQSLKKSLMQDLLTGKVRVTVN